MTWEAFEEAAERYRKLKRRRLSEAARSYFEKKKAQPMEGGRARGRMSLVAGSHSTYRRNATSGR